MTEVRGQLWSGGFFTLPRDVCMYHLGSKTTFFQQHTTREESALDQLKQVDQSFSDALQLNEDPARVARQGVVW